MDNRDHSRGLSPRAQVPRAPASSVTLHHGTRPLSPNKPTLHLSPRKFQQLQQQQRQAVLRGMLPLSPIRPLNEDKSHASGVKSSPTFREPVPWNPAWLPFPVDSIPVASAKAVGASGLSFGTTTLDAWLQSYDQDILLYESLEKFIQVKLPEALAFCQKMEQQIAEAQEQERIQAAMANLQSAKYHGTKVNAARIARQKTMRALRTTTTAMSRFPVRFRIAVFANLMERTIVAMTQSAGLAHLRPWLLQARQELFRAVFADYDEYSQPRTKRKKTPKSSDEKPTEDSAPAEDDSDSDDSDDEDDSDEEDDDGGDAETGSRSPISKGKPRLPDKTIQLGPEAPRPLSFFLSRVPFLLKLQDDTQRRTARFQRHQVVLRRIVQSLYRSLGTVFHAWKMHVRQKREERLNDKGAQLTAMVVIQRGLVRTIFVEWSKCALKTKLARAQEREAHLKKVHEERVDELYKELFLLQDQNARLQAQLLAATSGHALRGDEEIEEGDEDEDDEG